MYRRLSVLPLLLAACWSSPQPEPTSKGGPRAAQRAKKGGKAPKAAAKGAQGKGQAAAGTPAARVLADAQDKVVFSGDLSEGRAHKDKSELAEGQPDTVVLLIVDTLRADHTSLCGYKLPNTPFLKELSERPDATSSCSAYSPATWTLPAHASFFTGKPTAEHEVHTLGTPLPERFETLAEHYADEGYQTLFVSGNPVFAKPAGGFWQGFDEVISAKGLVGPLRKDFPVLLGDALSRRDNSKPLFLVVNIFDAHDPYPAIPASVGLLPPQPKLNLHPHTADPNNPYYAFVTGRMEEDKQPGWIERVTNAYDHAVYVADRNVKSLFKALKKGGWLDGHPRIVITSDHGEHLGEHGLMRHGSTTWQTVTRVPFLWIEDTEARPKAFDPALSATSAWQVTRDGRLPAEPLLIQSASARNDQDFKPSWPTVSIWATATDKITWLEGDLRRYNLADDPMEESPLPLPADHPMKPVLMERVQAHEAAIEAALGRDADEDVMEMLKEVGYVQ